MANGVSGPSGMHAAQHAGLAYNSGGGCVIVPRLDLGAVAAMAMY